MTTLSLVPYLHKKDGRFPEARDACSGNQQQYEYQDLPEGPTPAIRLFRLEVPTSSSTSSDCINGIIQGSLETIVSDRGRINLPYVALSYTWDQSDHDEAEVQQPILVDGKIFYVRPNLGQALISLRKLISTGVIQRSYIWIDALCINQDNLEEKSSQVNMMNSIFEIAETTIAWSGSAKPVSARRLGIIFNRCSWLSQKVRRAARFHNMDTMIYWDTKLDAERQYAEAGLPPRNAAYWKDFVALLGNRWWTRAWIIQEYALAQRLLFVSGTTILPLDDMEWTITHLFQWDMPKWLKPKKNGENFATYGQEMSCLVSIRNGLKSGLRGPSDFDYRAFAQGEIDDVPFSVNPPMTLFYALDYAGDHKAKNVLDRVYGLLGLCKGYAQDPKGPWLIVNYEKSRKQVFVDTTQYLIESASWLGVLAMDSSKEEASELPTFVPDFEQFPTLRFARLGFKDTILPSLLAFSETAPSHGYPRVHGDRLDVWGRHLGTVTCLGEPSTDLYDGTTAFSEGARVILGSETTYCYTGQHRFEAAWRTLLEDDEYIKDPIFGKNFLLYWLKMILLQAKTGQGGVTGLADYLEANPAIDEVFTSFFPSVEVWQDLRKNLIVAAERSDFDSGPLYEMLDEGTEPWRYWLTDRMFNRRIFCTDQGHLGNSRRIGVQVGDMVWMLARAPCAFILRKVQDETSSTSTYKLVTRAYIHGLDSGGSVLADLKSDWENLTII